MPAHDPPRFSLRRRIRSFAYAFRGVRVLVRTQHNAWLHAAATACVISLGWRCALSRSEWFAVILAIGLVWAAEALNTAVEYLADELSMEQREGIRNAKDLAAGGVLLAAVAAAVVGAVVFVPHLR
jgi:diacylglycerol kinase (ATP)